MVSSAERRLDRVLRKYNDELIDEDYLGMYITPSFAPDSLERAFASIHARLDIELDFMNQKARSGGPFSGGGHFNAENSRRLIDLIDEFAELKLALEKAGKSLTAVPEYQRVLDGAKAWLVPSGGSPIPEGFTPVLVEKYDAVFGLADAAVVLADHSKVSLTVVGEGAFAMVHKFVDPNYDIPFARKKLKRNASDRDSERFRREYEIMKGLDFPHILRVYRYNEADNSYTMEFCESTLEEYVKRRNNQPQFDFSVRRRIALQFLYGLNYLHWKGICHRDLSLKNVLLRVCSDGAVTVKLSDFGLAKPPESDFTKTDTEIKGTFVDPALDKFKDFEPVNDIYVVGIVLSYIFKGVSHLLPEFTPLGEIIHKCSASDPTRRYQTVLQIIDAVENLETEPIGAPA
ncbi:MULTISPECIES: protein kinase family protein [unclassified Mycolicibacterium]|uniref:protein kinase family protein n=1 Tax=unclassified Mycolicibacterium TaxID=2636767 RepID=UPI0012DF4A81|nr:MULTISPECIES: protein kinase family protein [unclassified Mycolicibacterium]MUL85043.1 protein kinase family protein [Mycolicibacterium sp. CBMA 329]MUL91010.1 protein kinase family protein [Mycolicibacterium sp. CBMA 331]MUL98319.1 protein kinase family protein [Mycolicibacterium sp. CBMA 334]MUM29072.1 protein kinase family protein [Mycolicibacterium sp. CBMA 295]MUM40769.1 protein kinase family protein [Mycolicibacterium sp. CBMA 247]